MKLNWTIGYRSIQYSELEEVEYRTDLCAEIANKLQIGLHKNHWAQIIMNYDNFDRCRQDKTVNVKELGS